MEDEEYERTLCQLPQVHVFKIPVRKSAEGHRASDWPKDPTWTGKLKIVAKGRLAAIMLMDALTNQTFAVCPVSDDTAVERTLDSGRYFVLRIQNAQGKHAFIGIAFNERNDAFDFNVALQEHKDSIAREDQASKGSVASLEPILQDLSIKQGEKLKINIAGGGARKEKRAVAAGMSGGGLLAPPPGSRGLLAPPPADKANFAGAFTSSSSSSSSGSNYGAKSSTTSSASAPSSATGMSDWDSFGTSGFSSAPSSSAFQPTKPPAMASSDWDIFSSPTTNASSTAPIKVQAPASVFDDFGSFPTSDPFAPSLTQKQQSDLPW